MAKVSVIIPAHNAEETIAETLQSLLAQTLLDWEAIVVDDASVDRTIEVAKNLVSQDSRIQVVSQSNMGVSVARNTGIQLAQSDWLLFLDADDWIAPEHLEKMLCVLEADPDLDAVHCGWALVAPDGITISQGFCPQTNNLFALFARKCAFVIHACIIRKALVETVGLFDSSLKACEDWDLWQRVARTGADFGAISEVLAFYRARPDSASRDSDQFCRDGLRVITQGHAPDSRVPNPRLTNANGQSVSQLLAAKSYLVIWAAGLSLGCTRDARYLLDTLEDWEPQLHPQYVAECLFESALRSTCQAPNIWGSLWLKIEHFINEFLTALEARSQAPTLANRTQIILERLVVEHTTEPRPIAIGSTYAVRVEVTEPIADIFSPTSIERIHCTIELERTPIGKLELPVCDGFVASYVLSDAIVAEYAWTILGKFFEHTIYSKVNDRQDLTVQELHNQTGWTVFLQELWGRPEWSDREFYDPAVVEQSRTRCHSDDGWLVLEVSEELPDVETAQSALNVVLTVGGSALGVVTVPVKRNFVSAQALRVALTTDSGFELCRACVREGLLGQTIDNPLSLRDRLAEATKQKRLNNQSTTQFVPVIPDLLDKSDFPIAYIKAPENTLLLGRRPEVMGTSASRRAILPIDAATELQEAATGAGEPTTHQVPLNQQLEHIVYAPEFISRSQNQRKSSIIHPGQALASKTKQANLYDRSYFESLFAKQADPWKYTNAYEQTKYEQTLSLLPQKRIKRALELACAEGHFTVQLAPRIDHLIASDISQIAIDRTAERCAELENLEFLCLDLAKDPLPGQFGLIVCSEVLYYIGGLKELRAFAQKVVNALEPGGYFLTAHANLVVDEPDRTGYNWDHPFGAKVIGETFASTSSLQLVKELKTPLYRIQLFQHQQRSWNPFYHSAPEIIELPQPTPPPRHVAHKVLWNGGSPQRYDIPAPATAQLPILMYHRVAPTGLSEMNRWRVTPQVFEEQLRYLRETGYYSITLEEWRVAMATRQPLSGRAVLITFDDGYLDFLTYAQPLLKQYGFSVTVFLVADKIGQSNSWDKFYGEDLPLLNWQQIRQLQAEGVEFGSHSASHRPLTGLSFAEVVKEGARSRAILQQELQVPIRAFAYPYGDCDRVVEHLIGGCGYTFGLSCHPGLSHFNDALLALPRIEIKGSDRFQDFVKKLREG
ncbi:glycosyltransferase [Phormidium sp. FACHB-592]|uniref:Glycosyltransferase n=1 Tax=Stenomitos frigidus AS-A4 TaxID=2933935 RepID=A0ABV0KIM4_9CYAN|nr:trifunctional glycosyltransferase/class I SAM-dependent methyltransferase/polysaccharide deacetylase [Phormidium sp. FACHB-592]MBD2075732.1 glycosyltransferase [Phormidium sp. FACHB-592]